MRVRVCAVGTEVERDFLPWLTGSVASELRRQLVVRLLLDDVVRYVTSARCALMDELEAQFLLIQSGADDTLVRISIIPPARLAYYVTLCLIADATIGDSLLES